MRDTTMAFGRIVALVVATIYVILFKPIQASVNHTFAANLPKLSTTSAQSVLKPTAPSLLVPKAEPPKPQPWAISSSPNGGTELVNKALEHYQNMGMTKQGAAMLIGNYLQEMPEAFTTGDPCHKSGYGDGGLALGFAQWHPGRRADMPCGFTEQLTWSVEVEMKRDSGGQKLHPLLFDAAATTHQIDYGVKAWERYGIKGHRYEYGLKILSQL